LVVSNTVSFNSAWLGGGLWLLYAPGTFVDNVITNNQAQDGGGLATFSSDALLKRNLFSQNTATDQGGGIYLDYANPSLVENRFSGNSADTGGGMHLSSSSPHLDRNILVDNHAREGGALWLYQSFAQTSNNLIAENRADRAGSGLYLLDSAPTLIHNTLTRNGGGDGSGIHIASRDLPCGTVSLTNTLLVSHTIGITVASGCTVALEATLWGSGIWANAADWDGEGTVLTGTVNLWEAPAFVDPVRSDYHIRFDGAAIDAGIDAGITVDLDGEPRPLGQGYDIGADEFFRAPGTLYLPLLCNSSG